ncbi:hypothetical protein [Martelella endophytica]|uniref:Uncharacterized protein n=1 Tax=Martelella endophytica TaxID=1486262 RepID=A0A0D5LR34_MAREN|nr:hypothetical protein [Martelella endophytica]AJY46581.1 hypothetical protein TM49_14300 [Martelella endophytica]
MSGSEDRLTSAAGSVALLMVLNKPVYPIYVWFLANSMFHASLISLASLWLYIAVWLMARGGIGLKARAGLVITGTLDTIVIAIGLGPGSGALWFLFPCLMLAASLFYAEEKWLSRTMVAAVFVAFIALLGRYGNPPVDDAALRNLFALNVSGAAALAAFIALRFPRIAANRR